MAYNKIGKSLNDISDERNILKKDNSLIDSAISEDTDDVLFDKSITVPSTSINVGQVIKLTEATDNLLISENVQNTLGSVISSKFTTSGSSNPTDFVLEAEAVVNVQTTDTTNITSNPLTFNYTSTPDRQANKITFRTFAAMSNVRGKLTHNSSGVIVQYIPSKAIYDAGTGGYNITKIGDNIINFIDDLPDDPANGLFYIPANPIRFIAGDQYDFEMVGDSINVKGDVSLYPYLLIDAQDGTTKDLGFAESSERNQTTGLLEGGVISEATSTTVDWTSGRGQVANYTDPENPVITDVTWDAVSGQSITNIATDGTTLFGYNSAGSIVEKLSTAVTISDAHDIIWFASVFHISSAIVSVLTAPGNLGYDGIGSFSDFINLVIGPANVDGNVYGANGTNLNIDVVGGNAYMLGSNFRTSPKLSDIVTLASDTALSFLPVHRSAGAGLSVVYGTSTTSIDPDNYDDGSGTLASVTTDYWTIQRIFRSRSGATFVAYGQQEFATKALALEALGSESFTEKAPLPFLLYRCSLVVQEGATDLSDTDEAEFFEQSSFRIAGATSSSSTIPGITSPGGSDSDIQYNDSNTFGGSGKFCYFDTTDVTNVSLHSGSATGQANLIFRDNGSGNKGYIRYDQDIDVMRMFTLSGVDIELSPGAGANVGINISAPTAGLHVYENDAATDDTTGIKIEQDGAGDAALHFLITGGDNWSMAIDQSDAERFKLAPNTDVGSSSTIDCSSTDINFLSGRTNLANTSTTTFLTMDSPTATGLVALLFHDNLDALHGSLAYNFSLDQLQLNSVIGGINIFTGLGLTQTNTSSASQNYNRMVSGGASCVTGFQIENTGSVIDLEMVYNQSTDRSYIIDRSASGLEVEAVSGVLFLKSATDDILLDVSSNAGRVEIAGLNHTDSHPILNIATSDGDIDFYVGEDTPAGSTSAVGGSVSFRDAELLTNLWLKRSTGAASTTGWHHTILSESNTSVDNALVTFDSTTGDVIQQSSGVTSLTTATTAGLTLTSQGATGGAAIEFYDNTPAIKFSIIHNDNTNENHIVSDEELTIQTIGASLNITTGDDIFINANSGANLITINDDFVFGSTTTDAILSIKTPSATATSGITLQNNTSTAEVEFEYDQNTDVASIILHNEVPLSITGADHDEDDILFTLASQGTNGAQTSMTVSDRTPIGNNTANPGSKHTTVDGVDSAEWIHIGASANNTDWKEVLTKDERTLVYNVDVDGIDQDEFILIGEYRVVVTGRTGDYATAFPCNNQHAAIEVNSITGSGVVTFTGVSMSESSGIPTATTEDITVDATGKYQTDKKWLEITNIDIPVGITAINYDVEVLGYLDMQNSDFTITGMRIDSLSDGNDGDISLHIIKVQDDGSKKCSLVDIEAYGYDAKDDKIVDDLRTGGDDRSYTATTSIWANGTNACLKVNDYSTYFTSDENVIEGLNKAEGIIIHFNGTAGGNVKHVRMLNLHLTIEMN